MKIELEEIEIREAILDRLHSMGIATNGGKYKTEVSLIAGKSPYGHRAVVEITRRDETPIEDQLNLDLESSEDTDDTAVFGFREETPSIWF